MFWWENLKKRDHLKGLGANGDNSKICLKEIVREVVNWIHLAQDKDMWQALVKAVMNVQVS